MSFEHISAPLSRAIATAARNYRKGHPMFTKDQLPDITEREKAFELHKAYEAANDRLYELEGADPEAIRLANARSEEAEAAYGDCGIELEIDGDGNAARCAVSGAPLLASDEMLFDYATGDCVLRIAIGLPPRPSEKQLLPDMVQGEAAE
jgi:hypothetical protein